MSTPSNRDLLHVAIEAAHLGGRRTLAYYQTGVGVDTKSNDTPVTRADREAEEVIRAHVAKHFPHHAILGEEQGATGAEDAEARWIIDPLDGTKSFIHGMPLYGTLVGVEVGGEIVAGACYLPALDEMVYAARGHGCWWNGRPARVRDTAQLEDATLTCTSLTRVLSRSDAFEKLANRVKLARGWSDCYGYVLVATGRTDIMLDPVVNAWDIAPLMVILEEAGGRLTTWSGQRTIWGGEAVATNGKLHDTVLDVLKNERRNATIRGA